MAGRYKAYPEYKEFGVEWVGEIPKGWLYLPLKRNFEIVNGSTPRSVEASYWDGEITWVTPADLSKVKGEIEKSSKNITIEGLNSCGTSIVPEGSLILSTRAPIGTIAISLQKLCTNQGCKSLINTTDTENKFYYYVLSVSGKQLNNLGRGTTFLELSTDELANYVVPTPSLSEQQKIANFLDHETAKIDTLIAKQEKLIELLKEKRQAVISHAVTKGLNPDAPMKDSGVEWLGEVPEHWILIPNKRLFELTPRKSQVESKKELSCSFIPMDKLKEDTLVLDEERIIGSVFDGYTYFENEDILMAKVTPCFENKNMVVARDMKNGIGFGSSEIYVLRCNQKVINDFIYYRLQEDSFMNIAIAAMTGAGGLKRVPADVITNFILALPPTEEQSKIVNSLKDKLRTFDELSVKAVGTIELMKERKTALISAAVTGKIDVRDWETNQ